MKRLLFIYNPHAGKELLKPKLADVIDIFVKAGYEVVAYPTQAYRDAYKKIKKYDSSEYDLIVCSGGDGTLDEVVTGMMKRDRDKREPIGYIPTGTTNDFASSLHIPRGLLEAADNAVNGEVFACDAGRFNDDIFVYIAAFGLFTDVSYQTKQSMKNVLGHLAYVLEGAKRLFNIPSYKVKVTHDDEVIEDEFVYGMVTNSRSVGGFRNLIAKQVGGRIKERRTELNITMPELGRRVGVNKSTIQRYEADGVDPKRTMVINGLAEALLTTPEWLTGLSDDKEYDTYTLCQRDIEEHIRKYLDTVSYTVKGEPHQQLLTTFLGKMVDLYTVMTYYFADAMEEVDRVAEDKGLKESLGRYAIESGAIMEQVYRKKMEVPIEDMKRFLDGILHIHDEGRTRMSMGALFGIVEEAEERLSEKENSVAP